MKAKVITDRDLKTALGVLKRPRDRAIFLVSVKAGLRACEIAGLKWGHVRNDTTLLELTKEITKGQNARDIPINKDLRAALIEHREASKKTADTDPVFPSTHAIKGKHLSANAVAAWFQDLYRRKLNWTGYSSHSGRRTFLTNAARKATTVGASLKDVQEMAGHKNLSTTQVYIESDSDARRKLVDLI